MMLFVFQFTVFTLLNFYCFIKWLKYYNMPRNFPPGPPSVPIFGVLPFIKTDFKSTIENWREDYGDIVGLQLGSDLAVVLSDFITLSKAFKDSRFTGRPKSLQKIMSAFFSSSTTNEENGGIVFTHGDQWTEQRRFALKTLRDFGFGKSGMEDIILNEVQKTEELLAKNLGNNCSSSLSKKLSVSVVNSLWTILTGDKIQHGNKTVQDIVEGTDDFIKKESLSGPLMMLPWLRHFPVINKRFIKSKQAPMKMRQMQDKTVKDHIANMKNKNTIKDEPKDFIEAYLQKIWRTTDKSSTFHGENGLQNLQRSLTDLFGAGSETSSSLLLFALLYMIKYPEIQKKIQKEIEEIVGADRNVTLDHRPNLPYTEAVLNEVMRHSCLVYTVPHATTCDVSLDSYSLPKDTSVYANVWNVMHSPKYWENPQNFKPERFLNESGSFQRDDRCIPFMMGKRFCIGQSLAQIQLFLFFAGILQKFELESPIGPQNVSTDPVVGFMHSCPNYEVSIKRRKLSCKF